MTTLSYELIEIEPTRIGFVVLQSDETLERDMFHMKGDADLFFSRVPNAATVNADTLQAMAAHMTTSASLFPETNTIDAIGYGCTSGTAQIGADNVARLIKDGTQVRQVSEPVSALIAACKHLGLRKIAFLSPYVEQVSENLRRVLRDNDVQSPQFGTFAEEADAKVVRIAPQSIIDAARHLTLGHD
ncbi:MAG: maleate cis-trans isomerase family protein, partial [Planktomarina sp.]